MKENIVRVPFDMEMAEKILNGEVKGKIITRSGQNVRIMCFDRKSLNNKFPILALIESDQEETSYLFNSKGYTNFNGLETKFDLYLEIPEYMTFKDGDIITYDDCATIGLINGIFYKNDSGDICAKAYVIVVKKNICTDSALVINGARLATESERQKFIDVLKASKYKKEQEYFKRFFVGVEQKKEYKFNPFDKVLVRESNDFPWRIDLFSHIQDGAKPYVCLYHYWKYCLPYNEQTAHLLGTTDNLD